MLSRRKQREAAQDAQGASGTVRSASPRSQLTQDALAAGAKRKAQCHLAGTIGSAGGKQTAQVGACGKQNQAGQQHQCRRSTHTGAEGHVRPRLQGPCCRVRHCLRIGLLQTRRPQRSHRPVAWAGGHSRLQMPQHLEDAARVSARVRHRHPPTCCSFTMGMKKSTERQTSTFPGIPAAPRR